MNFLIFFSHVTLRNKLYIKYPLREGSNNSHTGVYYPRKEIRFIDHVRDKFCL